MKKVRAQQFGWLGLVLALAGCQSMRGDGGLTESAAGKGWGPEVNETGTLSLPESAQDRPPAGRESGAAAATELAWVPPPPTGPIPAGGLEGERPVPLAAVGSDLPAVQSESGYAALPAFNEPGTGLGRLPTMPRGLPPTENYVSAYAPVDEATATPASSTTPRPVLADEPLANTQPGPTSRQFPRSPSADPASLRMAAGRLNTSSQDYPGQEEAGQETLAPESISGTYPRGQGGAGNDAFERELPPATTFAETSPGSGASGTEYPGLRVRGDRTREPSTAFPETRDAEVLPAFHTASKPASRPALPAADSTAEPGSLPPLDSPPTLAAAGSVARPPAPVVVAGPRPAVANDAASSPNPAEVPAPPAPAPSPPPEHYTRSHLPVDAHGWPVTPPAEKPVAMGSALTVPREAAAKPDSGFRIPWLWIFGGLVGVGAYGLLRFWQQLRSEGEPVASAAQATASRSPTVNNPPSATTQLRPTSAGSIGPVGSAGYAQPWPGTPMTAAPSSGAAMLVGSTSPTRPVPGPMSGQAPGAHWPAAAPMQQVAPMPTFAPSSPVATTPITSFEPLYWDRAPNPAQTPNPVPNPAPIAATGWSSHPNPAVSSAPHPSWGTVPSTAPAYGATGPSQPPVSRSEDIWGAAPTSGRGRPSAGAPAGAAPRPSDARSRLAARSPHSTGPQSAAAEPLTYVWAAGAPTESPEPAPARDETGWEPASPSAPLPVMPDSRPARPRQGARPAAAPTPPTGSLRYVRRDLPTLAEHEATQTLIEQEIEWMEAVSMPAGHPHHVSWTRRAADR